MLPPYISHEVKSNAEKRVFETIKGFKDADDNWFCLHSLGLSSHMYKKQGEIDFLLIGPPGIFVLEVKGGRVERVEGVWYFINRFNKKNKKAESPFQQASSAMFSLMNYLKQNVPSWIYDKVFGYGVMFPDFRFEQVSPEWDQKIIYDLRDRINPFSVYLNRLISFWRTKNPNKLELTASEIKNLVNVLRGDFEVVEPIGKKVADLEEKILQLTESQYRALDRMSGNARVFFRGTAGTGKTLLAVEKAKRASSQGKSVLFLCYNRLLAGKLRAEVSTRGLSGSIHVNSINKYFYDVIEKADLLDGYNTATADRKPNEIFKQIQPDFFLRAIEKIEEQYDVLVVDEGQDLLCDEYIVPLDFVLKGGFESGEWVIFYDSNNQGELYQNFDASVVESLKRFGAAEYWLDTNCRNTRPIALQTSVLTGFRIEETLVEEGEKVQYLWYRNVSHQAEEINKTCEKLLDEGVQPYQITLLNMGLDEDFTQLLSQLNYDSVKIDYSNVGNLPRDRISYASVSSYKGLENNIIIVCGIDRIDGDWINTHNYIAMTRARNLLYLCLKRSLFDNFQKKIASFVIQ